MINGHTILPPQRRIMVFTGSRADYSRIKTVLRELSKRDDVELLIVVGGPHLLAEQGGTIEEIQRDGFSIHTRVPMVVEGRALQCMASSVGLGVVLLSQVFQETQPDILVVPTDRYETLAATVAASLMNIPVAHIQGGELSGTIDESIRHAITKLAHIHFPATELSRQRIIRMGENPEHVFMVGCPGTDVLLETDIGDKPVKPYILMLQHPVTTEYGEFGKQYMATWRAVNTIAIANNFAIVSIRPNSDAGAAITLVGQPTTHVPHEEFIRLMAHASVMVGNSSAGIRESGYFGTPVVNVGTRQNTRERGENVYDTPYDTGSIRHAIEYQLEHGDYEKTTLYGDGSAGRQIAEILATIDLTGIVQKSFKE